MQLVQDRVVLRGLCNAKSCSCSAADEARGVSTCCRSKLLRVRCRGPCSHGVLRAVGHRRLLCVLMRSVNDPLTSRVSHRVMHGIVVRSSSLGRFHLLLKHVYAVVHAFVVIGPGRTRDVIKLLSHSSQRVNLSSTDRGGILVDLVCGPATCRREGTFASSLTLQGGSTLIFVARA